MTTLLYARETPHEVGLDDDGRTFLAPSIFLAGPTLRGNRRGSWRERAIELLSSFEGLVVIPENRNPEEPFDQRDWTEQVDWELKWLHRATVVLFWVPRDMVTLPGLTTNVEFGLMLGETDGFFDPKVVLGYPIGAPHTAYLGHLARRYKVPICHTLEYTIQTAVKLARDML